MHYRTHGFWSGFLKSVFRNYDYDHDGYISQEDFESIAANFPFLDSFCVLDKDQWVSMSYSVLYIKSAFLLILLIFYHSIKPRSSYCESKSLKTSPPVDLNTVMSPLPFCLLETDWSARMKWWPIFFALTQYSVKWDQDSSTISRRWLTWSPPFVNIVLDLCVYFIHLFSCY